MHFAFKILQGSLDQGSRSHMMFRCALVSSFVWCIFAARQPFAEITNMPKKMREKMVRICHIVEDVSEYYEVEGELGKGTFGKVWLARERETNEPVAIKQMARDERNWNSPFNLNVEKEVRIMKMVSGSDCVVNFKFAFHDMATSFFVVMEYFPRGSLSAYSYLSDNPGGPKDMAVKDMKTVFESVVRGLRHIHRLGVIHRDIKPENIMLTGEEGKPFGTKLIDFGLAEDNDDARATGRVGTVYYMAPEIVSDKNVSYGPEVDVWSVGVTVMSLFCNPYPGAPSTNARMIKMMKKASKLPFAKKALISDKFLENIARRCLVRDPRKRSSAEDLVSLFADHFDADEGSRKEKI